MKLILSNRFKKDAAQLIKKNPALKEKLADTLLLLQQDVFHPSLKTHKLKGKLKGYWSSSWGYDPRIIFDLNHQGEETQVELLTIGSHDEVY